MVSKRSKINQVFDRIREANGRITKAEHFQANQVAEAMKMVGQAGIQAAQAGAALGYAMGSLARMTNSEKNFSGIYDEKQKRD